MVLCLKAWKSRSLPGFDFIMYFSIIIPVYNEGLNIEKLLDEISYSLKKNPGNDLLFHALRQSTIGANSFHGRVRDGIGCLSVAMVTRKLISIKLFSVRLL